MDFMSILRVAWRALSRNKLRSSLTMLGVIIGVGAVIAMVGVGQGASQAVQQQISAMGSNVVFVSSGTVNRGGLRLGWGQTKSLVYDDMRAIVRECAAVRTAAPGASSAEQVVFANDNWFTNVKGSEPEYFDIRDWSWRRVCPLLNLTLRPPPTWQLSATQCARIFSAPPIRWGKPSA